MLKLNADLLREIIPVIAVPAIRIAYLVDDLLMLIYKRLEPLPEFRSVIGSPLAFMAAIAMGIL